MPFLDAPLTSDEGGYAEIARLWARGHGLYGANWVDRPQGLLIVFRILLSAGITTSVGLRLFAAALAAVLVLLAFSIGALTGGTLSGLVAGALTATAGASPFIEGFTLSGELIASVLAAAAVLAFVLYQPSERPGWLVVAGLAAGSAWMVKQSFFDAAVAIAVCLWGSWRRAPLFALAVLVPVLAGVIGSGDPAAWYRSVIGYSLDASGGQSPWQRLTHLGGSLLPASKALLAVSILAALGWPRAPKLLRVWLVVAALGVLVGGNLRPHYYLQLVAPLALVAAFVRAAPRIRVALAAAAGAVAVLFAVPLWGATDAAQARTIWPADRHLQSDAAVARSSSRTRVRHDGSTSSGRRPTSTTSPIARRCRATSGCTTSRRSTVRSPRSGAGLRRAAPSSSWPSSRRRSRTRRGGRRRCFEGDTDSSRTSTMSPCTDRDARRDESDQPDARLRCGTRRRGGRLRLSVSPAELQYELALRARAGNRVWLVDDRLGPRRVLRHLLVERALLREQGSRARARHRPVVRPRPHVGTDPRRSRGSRAVPSAMRAIPRRDLWLMALGAPSCRRSGC